MSIINEALKKAEKEKALKEVQPEAKPEPLIRPSHKAKPNNLSRIFIYIGVLSILFYAASAIILFAKKRAFDAKVIPPKFTAAATAPEQTAEQSPIVQAVVPQVAPLQAPAIPQTTEEKPVETEKTAPAPAVYVPDEELPRPNLNGTILGKGEPLAIIENIILKKGEYINGAQITDIFDNEVELSFKGRKYRIRTR